MQLTKTRYVVGAGSLLIGVLILGILYMSKFASEEQGPVDETYKNASLSPAVRVENLLSQMTLQEKVAQMALVEKNSVHENEDVSSYSLGAILSGAGAKPATNTSEGWKDMVASFTDEAKKSRLGIPLLYGVDAIHGHGNVPGATVFPHAIGLGAAHNPALTEEVGAATARELAATGIFWSYSPNLDAPQDIRWGRVYETFSLDISTIAALGSAFVHGTQGRSTTSIETLATAKHFLGAGAMTWESSTNKNFKIDQGRTPENESMLREMYLPPFKAAVDAGVMSVMAGLSEYGGKKIAEQKYLLTDILKQELGFKGFVVSDWYGVYEIPGGDYFAAVTAINAGVDMVMLPFDYKEFIRNVTWAVKLGDIPEERIDDAVRRILSVKFALGLFDDKESTMPPLEVIGSTEHRALARQAVSESVVLLKNRDAVLPIRNTVQHIRVAGSAADNVGRQAGAWTVEWQGIDGNWLPGATSILAGIQASVSRNVRVEYNASGTFENSSEKADIGIAVVGEKPYAEGWGDNPLPILDEADRAAIRSLQQHAEKVVVIIVAGRPLLIEHEVDAFDALVMAWLPGSEGGGVADVLFGRKPFTGTLPVPWPRRIEELPFTPYGVPANGAQPLFPLGFGLTSRSR